ncbi:hypothetical protein [Streptomyces sp. NPDC048473]|uniref:hypothetical protein n=1 Tax=unclassified Streptomyces TaxID=2593676 RepID=UPI003712F3F6
MEATTSGGRVRGAEASRQTISTSGDNKVLVGMAEWRNWLQLAVRWRHHASAGLSTRTLVADIREDLHHGPVDQELDQP